MKQALKYLSFLFLLTGFAVTANAQGEYLKIKNYQVYFGEAKSDNQEWITLRQFKNEGKTYLLLVNPQTLQTKVDDAKFYDIKQLTIADIKSTFKNTHYINALQKAEDHSAPLQNAGITSGPPNQRGISLTADLCPSHKPLDRRVFTAITTGFENAERPVPIALSVSGLWMQKHQQDLEWLKQLQHDGQINVTWINHTFNHNFSLTAPLNRNFLLEPGTNINHEVLETEKTVLKNGLLPSVFFRFPGLVSDKYLVERITSFGLITIGTDAWLAKGQQPKAGSIVLIHANGNEPVGVDDWVRLLKVKALQIIDKQWLLYDLRQSVADKFGIPN